MASVAALVSAGLLYTYAKNLRRAKTKFTVGLVLFAVAVVVENIVTAYIYFQFAQTYPAALAIPLIFVKALELTGFAVLLSVTLRL